MFWDYDFLCNVYGLSGAAGTYPCCGAIPPNQRCKHPTNHSHMYWTDIERAYFAFKRDEKDKTKAAKYHNVVRCPVFLTELDRVCPLYLHIILDIMKKCHSLLGKKVGSQAR